MWDNNQNLRKEGLPGQNNYQDNYLADEDFVSLSSGAAGLPGPQFFQQSNQMPEGYLPNQFDFFNMNGLEQNAHSNPTTVAESIPQQNMMSQNVMPQNKGLQSQNTMPPTTGRPALTARAEELKAQLLKKRNESAKSATSPVITKKTSTFKSSQEEMASLLRGSTHTPSRASKSATPISRPTSVTLGDVEDLITEAKAAVQTSNKSTAITHRSKTSTPQPSPKIVVACQAAQAKSTDTNDSTNVSNAKSPESRQQSSTPSEGEIREDIEIKPKYLTTPQGKLPQAPFGPGRTSERVLNKSHGNVPQTAHGDGNRRKISNDDSLHGFKSLKSTHLTQSSKESHGAKITQEVKPNSAHYNHEPSGCKQSDKVKDKQNMNQSDDAGSNGNVNIRHGTEIDSVLPKDEEGLTTAQELILGKTLAGNKDLRHWLDLTGWNNLDYRTRSLNRHRAIIALDQQKAIYMEGVAKIAALDQEKAKLLEEMLNEEGLSSGRITQGSIKDMLPPSTRAKISTTTSAAITRTAATEKHAPTSQHSRELDTPLKQSAVEESQDATKKRTFRDYESSGGDRTFAKSADGPDRSNRRKYEDDHRRSNFSLDSPSSMLKNYEDNDYYEERGHGAGRGRSYERENSPGYKGYMGRQSARSVPYANQEDYHKSKDTKGSERSFVHIGNYRGRAFDPTYRGIPKYPKLGRGRANYNDDSDDFNRRNERTEGFERAERPRSSRAPFMKRDNNTRYFIVKSFNGENVEHCMEDSIWTTQIQNGPMLTEAFETCDDVILVFSVNRSKAFQGYARMVSAPGAEPTPQWLSNLNWENAGAFKVEWLNKTETHFRKVGHLTNSLNEGMAVLVGKDGQEIERECGHELLKLLDEEQENQRFGDAENDGPGRSRGWVGDWGRQ